MRYLLIGLLVGLFALTPGPLQAQDTAELPTFKVGDNWTYQRTSKYDRTRTGKFVVTVTSVSDSGFAIAMQGGSRGPPVASFPKHTPPPQVSGVLQYA